MRAALLTFSILAIATAAPAAAQPQAMTVGEAATLLRAVNRGQLLHAYDQAAWHGTDDFVTKAKAAGTLERLQARGGGWIVDGPESTPELVFFDRDASNPRALFVAQFTNRGTKLVRSRFVSDDEPSPITPERKRLIAAQRAAYAAIADSDARLCADTRPNTVVLPPETPGGPTLVYFLTPQTRTDSVPAGGHFLVEVDAAGKAGKPRKFTNSCIDLPTRAEKGKGAALNVSHLLDPTPTEIHIFTMYAARMPLYVMTTSNSRLWLIESAGGRARVRLIDTTGK